MLKKMWSSRGEGFVGTKEFGNTFKLQNVLVIF